jgi:hypothetical protein
VAKDTLNICKGELVVLTSNETNLYRRGVECYRRTNQKEDEAWAEYVRQYPTDDAGEPQVRSSDSFTSDDLPNGTCAIFLKAQCTTKMGWYPYGHMVQVMVPFNGNTYYVSRQHVAKAVKNENSDHE